MELNSLISKNKQIEIEYPGLDGFKVKVTYLSRERSLELRKKCTTVGFNKKTRQPEDTLDEKLFAKLYSEMVVVGWSGLKYKYLNELLPVDLSGVENLDEEVVYTKENAADLINNSTYFDSWVGEVISDVANFNKGS